MTDLLKPGAKPERPYFSSGPCAKPPGWHADGLASASLGRSHRSKIGKSRIVHAMDVTRNILKLPDTHRIGIVPASDTGAVEMAMWSLLGSRPVENPVSDRRAHPAGTRTADDDQKNRLSHNPHLTFSPIRDTDGDPIPPPSEPAIRGRFRRTGRGSWTGTHAKKPK